MEYYIEWIVGYLITCVIFGFITQHVAKSKGYDSGFAWGFWLGVIGLLVVGFRPNIESKESPAKSSDIESPAKSSDIESVPPGSIIINPKSSAVPLCKQRDGNALEWISAGTAVELIGTEEVDGWVKVQYNGIVGYLKSEQLVIKEENIEKLENNVRMETSQSDQQPDSALEILEVLQRLAKLHDDGVLTDEEFNKKKETLLAKI